MFNCCKDLGLSKKARVSDRCGRESGRKGPVWGIWQHGGQWCPLPGTFVGLWAQKAVVVGGGLGGGRGDGECRQTLREAWREREGAQGCRIKEGFGIFKLFLSKSSCSLEKHEKIRVSKKKTHKMGSVLVS